VAVGFKLNWPDYWDLGLLLALLLAPGNGLGRFCVSWFFNRLEALRYGDASMLPSLSDAFAGFAALDLPYCEMLE